VKIFNRKDITEKKTETHLNNHAPDFSAKDIDGNMIALSQFRDKKNVFLVFNRGFT
jgi:peroxiredoxin